MSGRFAESGCSIPIKCGGRKVADSLRREMSRDEAVDVLLPKPLDLDQRLLKCEHETIKQALAQTDGSVVHAAPLIGRTYQGLSHMIEAKHPDLLTKRTPIRHRPRKRVRPRSTAPVKFSKAINACASILRRDSESAHLQAECRSRAVVVV